MEMKPRLPLLITPLLAICAVLAIIIVRWGPETVSRDFTAFYAAAQMVVECPESLYNAQTQLKYQKSLGLSPNYLPFPYPAVVPLLYIPFTWVSLSKAYWLMLGINIGLLFLCLLLMIRRFELKPEEARLLLLVASTGFPIFINLIAGQFAFVSLLLLVLFFADTKRNRGTAGIWAGCLVVKPSLLAVPLLILLLKRNKRALVAAATTVALILALCWILVGRKGLSDELALFVAMGRHPAALAKLAFMHNLRALSYWLHLGDVGAVILSVLVVVLLWTVPRAGRSTPVFFMASLIATALVSPHLHTYDLSILLPLVVFGVPTGIWYQRACVFGPLAILLSTYVFGAVPIIPAVLLAFFVLCISKARRRSQPTVSESLSGAPVPAVDVTLPDPIYNHTARKA